jgi:hypothetical protein
VRAVRPSGRPAVGRIGSEEHSRGVRKVGAYFDGSANEGALSGRVTPETLVVLQTNLTVPNKMLGNRAKNSLRMLQCQVFASALRSTAAPGPQACEGASYRSRRAALCGVAATNSAAPGRARPNPSVEADTQRRGSFARFVTAVPPLCAPHLKRWASQAGKSDNHHIPTPEPSHGAHRGSHSRCRRRLHRPQP